MFVKKNNYMLKDQKPDPNAPGVDEIIDVEEYALSGKPTKPHAVKFRIKIDNQKFDVQVPSMTGREILKLVAKTPDRCQLRQRVHGKVVTVGADEKVSFATPGLERF